MDNNQIVSSIPKSQSDLLLETWGYSLTSECVDMLSSAGFKKELPVFDIATGSGRTVSVLTRLGYEVITGDYDLSKKNEAEARITLPFLAKVSFLSVNIEEIPFDDNSVESITCLNTLHELENPQKGLAELIRITAPAGRLLVADFNSAGFDVMDRLHAVKFNENHPRGSITVTEISSVLHNNFLSVKEINTRLNKAFLAENKK